MSGQPSILFVDDSQNVLDSIRRVMVKHKAKWTSHFALSVDEAEHLARKHTLGLVVCDVTMPKRDGFDLLELFRSRHEFQGIPVVMLTGIDDATVKRRALDCGALDLLTKPISEEDLVARIGSAIRVWLAESHLRRENRKLDEVVRRKTAALNYSRSKVVWSLARASEGRDRVTGHHIARVAYTSLIIARQLGLENGVCEDIFLASALHDVGKLCIPDAILNKESDLTADEWRVMQSHCELGAALLRDDPVTHWTFLDGCQSASPDVGDEIALLRTPSSIALTHHERWDGKGYPRGLAGTQIPIEGRIVAIADAFDVITHERPYKSAGSNESGKACILADAGSHFDPDVTSAFVRGFHEIVEMVTRIDTEIANSDTAVIPTIPREVA